MDKLQPIIKNHFWILAGLLVPIGMYAFFSANSSLNAATEEREKKLEDVLRNIPGGANDPNEKYAEGLSSINDAYKQAVEKSIIDIWYDQKEEMTWPAVVQRHVPEKFMGEFEYAGVVAYQAAYEQVMKDLQARVEPVMPLTTPMGMGPMIPGKQPEMADVPWKQKVILAASIPQAHFGRMRATSEQIWNAQIDVWLIRNLFDAVARLNEDKDSVTEAVLRRIERLELVGGDGEPVLTGGSAGGDAGGYGGYGGSGGMMEAMESARGSYGSGKAGGAGVATVDISFSPAQEFGSPVGESTESADDSYGGGGGYAEMGGMVGSGPQVRYIADSEDKPYLERGFYMSVIIMQDKIPDFLVELANSEWPVRVTRFHVGKNPHYTGVRSSGFGPGFGPGGYGGGYGTGQESFNYDSGSERMSSGYGGESPYGGVGTANAPSIEGVGNLTANLPPFANDALQHPNLVQMDLLGVITMYKQPESIVAAIEAGEPVPGPSRATPAVGPGSSGGNLIPSTPATDAAAESPATPTTPDATEAIESLETLPEASTETTIDETQATPDSNDASGANSDAATNSENSVENPPPAEPPAP